VSRSVDHGGAFDVPLVSSPAPAGAVSAASTTPIDDTASGRDTRRSTRQPRARALVATEVYGLESLLHVTQPTSQDRPLLLRRLAEDYVELEHASNGTAAIEAQRRAIARYVELTKSYPGYAQGDEALYYLGYEYEQANDGNRARKTYFDLLQKRPDSKYIPNAYLAFGEFFFKEASTDASKWSAAREAYAKVISSATPADPVYAYACYKLAQVLGNLGDQENARKAFQKAVDYTVAHPELPNAAKLEEMARRDLVALDAETSVDPLLDGAIGDHTTEAASPEE
jgi:TolA-binding protein